MVRFDEDLSLSWDMFRFWISVRHPSVTPMVVTDYGGQDHTVKYSPVSPGLYECPLSPHHYRSKLF